MALRFSLRTVLLFLLLLAGNFFGVVMRPKDIEELLHAQKEANEETTTDNESGRPEKVGVRDPLRSLRSRRPPFQWGQ